MPNARDLLDHRTTIPWIPFVLSFQVLLFLPGLGLGLGVLVKEDCYEDKEWQQKYCMQKTMPKMLECTC